MPLRPDLRNLRDPKIPPLPGHPVHPEGELVYRGPSFEARRKRLLERAGHKCEECRAPDLKPVLRACGWWAEANLEASLLMTGGRVNGRRPVELLWHHAKLAEPQMLGFPRFVCHWAGISLAMVHLDQNPLHNGDDNLAMLCQWDHLHYYEAQHRETRRRRKDAARPLLAFADVPLVVSEKTRFEAQPDSLLAQVIAWRWPKAAEAVQ